MRMSKLSEYARGYQDAMRELTEILDRDGIPAMLVYLGANTAPDLSTESTPTEGSN